MIFTVGFYLSSNLLSNKFFSALPISHRPKYNFLYFSFFGLLLCCEFDFLRWRCSLLLCVSEFNCELFVLYVCDWTTNGFNCFVSCNLSFGVDFVNMLNIFEYVVWLLLFYFTCWLLFQFFCYSTVYDCLIFYYLVYQCL